MHRSVAISALAVALAVTGGAAVAVSHSPAATTVQVGAPSASPTTSVPRPGIRGRVDNRLHKVLAELVAKGTITQKQADAIEQAMAAPDRTREQLRLRGTAAFRGMVQDWLKPVADVIGITPEQLMTELRSGSSLAEIAKAHGVVELKVVAAIQKGVDARIDESVAKGRFSAERAEQLKDMLHELIVKLVDGAIDALPDGPRHRSGGSKGHAPSSTAPPTTARRSPGPPSTARVPTTKPPATSVAPKPYGAPSTAPPTTTR